MHRLSLNRQHRPAACIRTNTCGIEYRGFLIHSEEIVTSPGKRQTNYDVLFMGEQTSLVMRLLAKLVEEGCVPAVLNGPRLIAKLKDECDLEVDHFECPPIQLPGRYRAPWIRKLEWPVQRSRLRAALRKINPAVIHLNYIKPQWALLSELGSDCPPVVATVWGTDLHRDVSQGDSTQISRIARVLQHAQVVTADSHELLDIARELAPNKLEAELKLVFWGISIDEFRGQQVDRAAAEWKRRLDLPMNGNVVLAPRRTDPRYSPERVLKAFAKSQAARTGHLVYKLFGDNPRTEQEQREFLTQLANDLGLQDRLRFAPPCPYDDLPGLYRMADLACFLLSHDGTPTTAFELMAAGVPMVMSDIPDYKGTIVDGLHAWLVAPDDARAAADKFDQILNQPQSVEAQRQSATRWVERYATMQATLQNFRSAYRQAQTLAPDRTLA